MGEEKPLRELLEQAAAAEAEADQAAQRAFMMRGAIAKEITGQRRSFHVSQDAFAQRMGRTQAYLSMIESGSRTPSWETLGDMANAIESFASTSTTTGGDNANTQSDEGQAEGEEEDGEA